MNIEIPPIPTIYNMVNLDGFDLATANGITVPGIYDKVYDALSEDKIEIFYNWKFADVILPPSYVRVDDSTLGELIVNEEIRITSLDSVSIIGISRPPVINSIVITENGTYSVSTGVDGYSPVVVEVPESPPPTLVTLSVTENGEYLPSIGEDGFSDVTVNVPGPILVSLAVTENGTYMPSHNEDGFSEVSVDIPDPVLVSLNATENGTYTPESGQDGFSEVLVNVPSAPALNQNLLVNSFFIGGGSQQGGGKLPVNQRGDTSYSTNASYTIDMWKLRYNDSGALTLTTNGISKDKQSGTSFGGIVQTVENGVSLLAGKLVTLSVLVTSMTRTKGMIAITNAAGNADYGTTLGNTVYTEPGLHTLTLRIPSNLSMARLNVWIDVSQTNVDFGSGAVTIAAAKLELGEVSTLARNEGTEASPIWVLNEIPNFEQELIKCQRFFQTFRTSSYRPTYAADFRPVMSSDPSLNTKTIGGVTYYTAECAT